MPLTINEGKLFQTYAAMNEDPAFKRLRLNGNRLVPGEGGNPWVFIVGEAPGASEAMRLRPFVGRSGQILRKLMATSGLFASPSGEVSIENCWLTNTVKYRPPSNRTPFPEEVRLSRPYLFREFNAVGQPEIIVCAGAVAYRAVVGSSKNEGARKIGIPFQLRQSGRWVWPMHHPSRGLYEESLRPEMERHWRKLGKWLDDNYPGFNR